MNGSMSNLPETKYSLGDIVYHRLREDKEKGMIVGITFALDGGFYYEVVWGGCGYPMDHFEMELTSEYLPQFDGLRDEDA